VNDRSQRIWSGIIGVGAFAALMVIDIVTDPEARSLGELLGDTLELALIVASATGVALLSGSLQRERQERTSLARDLQIARAEGEAWRQRAQTYLAGLGEEIKAQFDQWQLTQSECEVGLLMLKGFSHAEIASLRGTTEATVRHQARAVYQKSNMPGRSAFCAYFLEDLLAANGGDRADDLAGHDSAQADKPPTEPSRRKPRQERPVDGVPPNA
jgi:DNA-binding CsgD family transcriptional regulator